MECRQLDSHGADVGHAGDHDRPGHRSRHSRERATCLHPEGRGALEADKGGEREHRADHHPRRRHGVRHTAEVGGTGAHEQRDAQHSDQQDGGALHDNLDPCRAPGTPQGDHQHG